MRPFRWDVSRREQLGRLPAGEEAESYPEFLEDLRVCCARVVAWSEDSQLVFVGRSPESMCDYLSGMLLETSWRDRVSLLNISIRYEDRLRTGAGPDVHALREHFAALHLTPREIATGERTIALVDLVSSGETLGYLTRALFDWARDEDFDPGAVKRRLRIIGITWRRHTSPNTWRWQQNAEWTSAFKPSAIKNISIPGLMWHYLGNQQAKVARTQPIGAWRDPEWTSSPPRDQSHLESLRLALRIFNTARTREEQTAFARCLAEQRGLTKPWLRSLLVELKR
jgi:hypothetical protein